MKSFKQFNENKNTKHLLKPKVGLLSVDSALAEFGTQTGVRVSAIKSFLKDNNLEVQRVWNAFTRDGHVGIKNKVANMIRMGAVGNAKGVKKAVDFLKAAIK